MKKSRHLQYLPFGFHISYLLKISGIDVSGETVVPPKSIALIDKTSLGKLDVGWNPGLGSFDYLSDHTIKIRRPKTTGSKPSTSAGSSRNRFTSSSSLEDRFDALTKLVLNTRTELHNRLDRLESLILSLIPADKRPPESASTPKMGTEAHPIEEDLMNTDVHQDPTFEEAPGMDTDVHTPVAAAVSDPEGEDEGGTEPLTDIDTDVQETEVEPDHDNEDITKEGSIDPSVEATLVVRQVLAQLNAKPADASGDSAQD